MKTKKITHITSLFLTLFWINNPVFAANLPDIRGMNYNPIDNSNLSQSKNTKKFDMTYSESPASLKGGVSELSAMIGKSQLIRFDEPVKRISVANPSLADLILISPKEMILNGKAAGVTSLIIWGEKGNPVFFDLTVKNDPTAFLNAVRQIAPNEDLNIKFTNDTSVILSGKVSSTLKRDKIKNIAEVYGFKLVDLAESATPQVILEVKIAEASRNFTKILNSSIGTGSQMDGSLKTIGGKATVIPETLAKAGVGALFNGSLNSFLYLPKQDFSALLNMAETKGFVKILAEPKLVSTNGNKASFNAGQQVPVPTSIGEGGNVAYELKDVGINVAFTPTVMENSDKVMLNINSEVSEIDTAISKDTTYGFKTRKAETTVELKNNQTLVIAGLLKRKDDSSKAQVPLFGSIPVFGKLFSNSQTIKEDTELIIIVTPRIIEPEKVDGV